MSLLFNLAYAKELGTCLQLEKLPEDEGLSYHSESHLNVVLILPRTNYSRYLITMFKLNINKRRQTRMILSLLNKNRRSFFTFSDKNPIPSVRVICLVIFCSVQLAFVQHSAKKSFKFLTSSVPTSR